MEIPEKQREIFDSAQTVLEKLLQMLGLSARVMLSEEFTVVGEDGEVASIGLNIIGDDLGILIGRRGQTMVALQHVIRLIIAHQMQTRIPIVLDVEGYKERRCEGLRMLAAKLAEQVKTRKIPFTMEPMPAFERRVVHLSLSDHEDVYTESTGEGESRKVVILPKKINR